MELIPIIILTKDNPEYLYMTLKSLSASELSNNPIIIVDDNSSLTLTTKFLYTNEIHEVTFEDWTNNKSLNSQEIADKKAAEILLNIPHITHIKGIDKQYTVVKTPKYLGPTYRTLFGINLGFTLFPNSKLCCILEDDVLFNKNWLKEARHIYECEYNTSNVGLISVYNEHAKNTEFLEYLRNDEFSGKMFLITNKFYKTLKNYDYFSTSDVNICIPMYEALQNIAFKLGFCTFVSNKSYIQNLEKRNLCNKDKILKYDNNFLKPIAWNNEL